MTATTAVRERPILFSGPMVRAILDDTKTQTRRVIVPQLTRGGKGWVWESRDSWVTFKDDKQGSALVARHCPYGAPGDRLWVREGWGGDDCCGVAYRANHPEWPHFVGDGEQPDSPWRSPIHMPRWASRLTLEITDVRVQRVQELTEADAIAEGATKRHTGVMNGWSMDWGQVGQLSKYAASSPVKGRDLAPLCEQDIALGSARFAFANYWDSLNAKRGHGWDSSPWVWALTFRRIA